MYRVELYSIAKRELAGEVDDQKEKLRRSRVKMKAVVAKGVRNVGCRGEACQAAEGDALLVNSGRREAATVLVSLIERETESEWLQMCSADWRTSVEVDGPWLDSRDAARDARISDRREASTGSSGSS